MKAVSHSKFAVVAAVAGMSIFSSAGFVLAQPEHERYRIVTTGTSGDDQLVSSRPNYDDRLDGRNGNDYLYGGRGNDVLIGGEGDDVLDGGLSRISSGPLLSSIRCAPICEAATDVASYESATRGVIVDLTKLGQQQDTVGAGIDTLIDIESVTGSNHDDVLIGNDDRNALRGNDGDDEINGGQGIDLVLYDTATTGVTISLLRMGQPQDTVGAGIDTLISIEHVIGSQYDDTLIGDGGSNEFSGLGGNDTMDGGDGTDLVDYFQVTEGAVTIDLRLSGEFQDTGAAGMDKLVSIEEVRGTFFNDTLIGDEFDNALMGKDGNDTLMGGAGNDLLKGDLGDNLIDGGPGRDDVFVAYSRGHFGVTIDLRIEGPQRNRWSTDTLVNIENLRGTPYSDTLTGNDDRNWLRGHEGDDRLSGLGGDDLFFGDAGDDILTGGMGINKFHYGNDDGNDRITDFGANDYIRLTENGFLNNFSDVQANLSEDSANNAVIVLDRDGASSVTLEGVRAENLGPDNFDFGR